MNIKQESRNVLHELYVTQEMSASDIGEIYNVSNVTVLKYLKIHNITIRDKCEARKARCCVRKAENTLLSNYGVRHPRHSEEIKDKTARTNLQRYGAENPFQSEEIKKRIRKTNRKNLGVEYPGQSQKVKNKIKDTIREKYGVDNPSQSPIVQL